MWLLALNGLAYLVHGVAIGRFRERRLPIRLGEVVQTVRDTLRNGMGLGVLTMLAGCDLDSIPAVERGLRQVSAFNDCVQARLFDPTRLAPSYPKSMVLKPPKFNAYHHVADVRPVDAAHWMLDGTGMLLPATVRAADPVPVHITVIADLDDDIYDAPPAVAASMRRA